MGDPVGYVDSIPVRNSLRGLRIVDIRASLPADKVVEGLHSTGLPIFAMPTCSVAVTRFLMAARRGWMIDCLIRP